MPDFRDFYRDYKNSVVRLIVESDGTQDVATGFHIGNGVVITARHVLADSTLVRADRGRYGREVMVEDRRCSEDPEVDLAALTTDFDTEGRASHVPVGGHLDDWIDDGFVMSQALILGFPKLPRGRDSYLMAFRANVNADIDRYDAPHAHFVLSIRGRAGLSGAPVISEFGFLLGVATGALTWDDDPAPTGFFVAVSVEPLLKLLGNLGVRPPDFPDEIWRLFE